MDRKWIAVAVAAALVVAGTAVFLLRSPPPPETPPPAMPPVPAIQPRVADAPLPLPAESDAQLRKSLGAASARPDWKLWLSQGDLLDRATVVADNLAEGVSPRKQLDFLAPREPFRPKELTGGALQLDEKSYRRYDSFGDLIASLDVPAMSSAMRGAHALLTAAYHKLGYPDRAFDDALTRALQRVCDAPVLETPPALKSRGALWAFSDDQLEALTPVGKHLVRMGPRNTRLIQQKARELAAALSLPVH